MIFTNFSQIGVRNRIQEIEIQTNSRAILTDIKGNKHEVKPTFSDIPRFKSSQFLQKYLKEVSLQIKQLDSHEYRLVTHVRGLGGAKKSLLHDAVDRGNLDEVRMLVEQRDYDVNGKINREKNRFLTPLYLACEKGFYNIAEYLIQKGADVNGKVELHMREVSRDIRDHYDVYLEGFPLFIACKNQHEEIVKLLLKNQVNVNAIFSKYHWRSVNPSEAFFQVFMFGGMFVDTDGSWGDACGLVLLGLLSVPLLPITFPVSLTVNAARSKRKFFKENSGSWVNRFVKEHKTSALKVALDSQNYKLVSLLLEIENLYIPTQLIETVKDNFSKLSGKAIVTLLDKNTLTLEEVLQKANQSIIGDLLAEKKINPFMIFNIACDQGNSDIIDFLFKQNYSLPLQMHEKKFAILSIALQLQIVKQQITLGDYENALEHCNQILKSVPNNQEVLSYRGVAHYYQGSLDSAMEDFTQALKLDARNPLALKWKASMALTFGKYQKAITNFESLVNLQPDDPWARLLYGYALLQSTKADEAMKQAKKALKLKPLTAAQILLGEVYLALEMKKDAKAAYKKSLKEPINEEIAYLWRARLSLKLGKTEQAKNDILAGLKCNPHSMDLLLLQGEIAASCQNYEEAIETCHSILKLNPPNIKEIKAKRDEYKKKLRESKSSKKLEAKEELLNQSDSIQKKPQKSKQESSLENKPVILMKTINSQKELLKGKLADLEKDIKNSQISMSDCNKRYGELEPFALNTKSAEFFSSRGHFYYKAAQIEANVKVRLAHLSNAQQDFEQALDFDPFIPEIGRLLDLIESQAQSISSAMVNQELNPK